MKYIYTKINRSGSLSEAGFLIRIFHFELSTDHRYKRTAQCMSSVMRLKMEYDFLDLLLAIKDVFVREHERHSVKGNLHWVKAHWRGRPKRG